MSGNHKYINYNSDESPPRLAPMASRFGLALPRRIGDAATPPLDRSVNFVVYHTAMLDTLCATMALTAGQEGWHKGTTMDDVHNPQ